MKKDLGRINYLEIIKRSWKTTWNNRYLWWFGFFASISSCGSINYLFDKKDENVFQRPEVADFLAKNFHWIAAALLAFLIIYIFLIILGIIGRGALIDSIEKCDAGKMSSFKDGIREGKKYFWKIFGISFLIGLGILAAAVVVVTPVVFLFFNHNYLIGVLMGIIAALILIPLIILSVYLRIYGYLYAVLGKLSLWNAIENAYNLFLKNVTESLIMGLLFIPIGIAVSIIVLAFVILEVIIFLVLGLAAFFIAGKIGVFIVIGLAVLVFLAAMIFLKSVYEVFAQSIWNCFFNEIAKTKKEEPVFETETVPVPVTKIMPVIETRKEV